MADILYLKIAKNIEVHSSKVYLGEIADMECTNKKFQNNLKVMKVLSIDNEKKGRYAVSVIRVIKEIQKVYPQLEVNNIGEADFIVTYEKEHHMHKVMNILKTIMVCFIAFFGAAFSIMTFNNDVDLPKLFGQLYEQFTGSASSGFTLLELSYSVGLGLGVLLFFNHFGNKRLTNDPSPLEVEMRLYEDNINTVVTTETMRKDTAKDDN